MNQRSALLQAAGTLLLVIFGNVLYALAVKLFLLPAGLVTGGTTGIALAINHIGGVPISMFVLAFNILMLAAGFVLLGKQFALTTIVSTFTYPLALEFFDRILGELVITKDILLCTLFSGLGIGLALGIVIRAGASTGGMDIPPLVLNKYFKIPVSVSLYVFDFCILLAQSFYNPPEKVLYGVLLVMVYTIVLDKLMLMGATKTEVKIISHKSEEIREAILHQLDRGVTILSGESGYLRQDTHVLLSVISNRELPRVEKIIHKIDPESFMVVGRVSEVRGRGFSMSKKYR
ncbi:MAG: YitT family protein [Lachnoclostridium edouardi]|uniref:YitT family protein n=1 Tax=Lachnoclostridium edouardi TaxID=1926283 RepID=UPI0026DDB268|nr:YitT family protein [Lachnoclostridium edouardi]MDO4277521.1 YitT family protein [Lachnoclostridium edouardi]